MCVQFVLILARRVRLSSTSIDSVKWILVENRNERIHGRVPILCHSYFSSGFYRCSGEGPEKVWIPMILLNAWKKMNRKDWAMNWRGENNNIFRFCFFVNNKHIFRLGDFLSHFSLRWLFQSVFLKKNNRQKNKKFICELCVFFSLYFQSTENGTER